MSMYQAIRLLMAVIASLLSYGVQYPAINFIVEIQVTVIWVAVFSGLMFAYARIFHVRQLQMFDAFTVAMLLSWTLVFGDV